MFRLRLQVESPQQGLGLPFDRRRRIHQVDPPFPITRRMAADRKG